MLACEHQNQPRTDSDTMGHLFLLCGPPGVGKTSLLKKISARSVQFAQRSRLTTRPKRNEEGDVGDTSLEYKFLSHGEFSERLSKGNITNFIEWNGNYYATQISVLNTSFEADENSVLLEDIPSAIALKEKHKQNVTVIFMFTGNKEDILHDLDFGSYGNSDNEYFDELKRRLGLKYNDSIQAKNRQPDDAERDEYIENEMKRTIPDIAFVVGKIRQNNEIRVLANRKNEKNEIPDETVNEFLTIMSEPRNEKEEKDDKFDPSEITVGVILRNLKVSQLWTILCAIMVVISAVAFGGYKAGSGSWP